MITSHKELEQFINFTNTFHPNLKFTWTISNTSLSFLDPSISISGDHLETDIYFKPTDSHSYPDYTSSHPPSCKNVIPYFQFLCLRCICSQDGVFHSRTSQMSSYFNDCNLPLPRFTCTSINVVYCIRCSRCGLLYFGETKRRLGGRFVKYLYSVRNKQHLPIANHFNSLSLSLSLSLSHSLGNMSILGFLQYHNEATHKLEEQHLIFCLGSLQPKGLNMEFTSFKISPLPWPHPMTDPPSHPHLLDLS
eukprot:g25951.t1